MDSETKKKSTGVDRHENTNAHEQQVVEEMVNDPQRFFSRRD